MRKIEDIINQIGEFSFEISGKVHSVIGALYEDKESIILNGRIDTESSKSLYDCNLTTTIWGTIADIPVTFCGSRVKQIRSTYGSQYAYVLLEPSEIIIGRSYSEIVRVTKMTASIQALSNMCLPQPLKLSYSFSKENPAVLNYEYISPIVATDRYGQLRIYQTFTQGWIKGQIVHTLVPTIEYTFDRPTELMDAVSRIASVRNLFSFFANYYIPLENIEFADQQSKRMDEDAFCDCALFLNRSEKITIMEEPFLITASMFEKTFQSVWDNWLKMYEEAIYIPTLFYEIICERSTRINYFLNLSQALEIYSKMYRESDVKRIAKMHERTKRGKAPKVLLKYRLEDSLQLIHIGLEQDDIVRLSKAFADMRNFYTHYDEDKHVEPTYEELFAACHVLRFVLVAVVYKIIGIANEHIKACRDRVCFNRIDVDCKTLLKYEEKSHC